MKQNDNQSQENEKEQ